MPSRYKDRDVSNYLGRYVTGVATSIIAHSQPLSANQSHAASMTSTLKLTQQTTCRLQSQWHSDSHPSLHPPLKRHRLTSPPFVSHPQLAPVVLSSTPVPSTSNSEKFENGTSAGGRPSLRLPGAPGTVSTCHPEANLGR